MAFPHARNTQWGSSLIELMIASLIGVIALGMIGSLVLSNQRTAVQRSKKIMLQQQMSSVLYQMKMDILRSGHNNHGNQSIKFSDATTILFVQPELVGYVYQTHRVTVENITNTIYRLEHQALQYCQINTHQPLSTVQAEQGCFNLFDPKQISVNQFSVQQETVAGESALSGRVVISLSASLVADSSIKQTMTLQITQRNWL